MTDMLCDMHMCICVNIVKKQSFAKAEHAHHSICDLILLIIYSKGKNGISTKKKKKEEFRSYRSE